MTAAVNPGENGGPPGSGASPARTFAFVVGIDRYDVGPTWDLDGPAKDAARFTSWLLERGVPADQILVFLSPPDKEPLAMPFPPGITVRPARREPLSDAIARTLPAWRGDLLWLFWAGHGVLTRDDHLRLFYADASTGDKRNLDLNSLLIALRSDLYAGFTRQIGVVDACQTYAERLQLATTLPSETLPYGQPLPGREQFVLYAASPGQGAVNLGSAQAGQFSQMVMEELAGPSSGNDWPPDMDLVATRLDQRFTELRAAGHASQTPTSFRWRAWTGSEHILGEAASGSAWSATTQARRPSGLALREMVERLLDLDVIDDPVSRRNVVHLLRKGLATTISYDSSSRPHVVNIITRSLDYPGGLTELMDAVKLYADPTDPALVQAEAAADRLAREAGQEYG